jgi:hypothetical protein
LRFRDVTEQACLANLHSYAHGCAIADYDCDGWPDLLVTGYGRLALYHNVPDGKGGRRFVEVTDAAQLHDDRWSTSAAFADFDGDGFPDIYICHYVDWSWQKHRTCSGDRSEIKEEICPPAYFQGVSPSLYRNNRDGTFTEVSKEAGLQSASGDNGMGLGVVAVDVNGDARPDIYAVNDTTRNLLFLNESTPGHLKFREIGRESGVALGDRGRADGSMGVDAADYDGCGRPSLWVTTFENEYPALYHNSCGHGRIAFDYATHNAGLVQLGQAHVGFGTGFLDLDNDGWEDLVLVNGHVRKHSTRTPLRQRPTLLKNTGTGQFAAITNQGGRYFLEPHRGRGLAIGDLDNDGRPDLVITNLSEAAVVLWNSPRSEQAPRNHWLGIELIGSEHRDVVGATVVVEVQGRRLTRFAKAGGSYLSSSDRRIIVGLGTVEKPGRVTVSWPRGTEQHWDGLLADRYWRLEEGNPSARPR